MKKNSALTDFELVSMYEQGNDEAFDELLARYQGKVFTYLMFLVKNESKAEDFLQETFAHAIVAIRTGKYQTTGKFGACITRIARNVVIDHSREWETSKVTPKDHFSQSILNSIKLSEECHEHKFIHDQQVGILRELLGYLPDVQREVVIMKFYEDMTFKEIAKATGVSINTSLGRMRYALINLRKLINEKNLALVG